MSDPKRPINVEHIEAQLDISFNWGYEKTRQDLQDLYSKAKRSQWDSDERLDWSIDVDLDKAQIPEFMHPLFGSEVYAKLDDKKRTRAAARDASLDAVAVPPR